MKILKYKITIKNFFIYSLCSFCLLTLVYSVKMNYKYQVDATERIEEVIYSWKTQDIKNVSRIANTDINSFNINTGFNDDLKLKNLINKYIYECVDFEINTININTQDIDNPLIKAKLTIKTYNNLEVLNTVINELINTEVEVDINYDKEKFISDNYEKIDKACQSLKKDYEKIIIVTFDYGDNLFISFDKNKEFYNALSGNMILFKEEVQPKDIKI